MSNYLAIATVTSTLKRMLEQDVGSEIPGVRITAKPPDTLDSPSSTGLNIFLYRVSPNKGYCNFDLPARDSNGEITNKPLLGLDLHYLITAYGADNDDISAHKVLASAMRVMHENPIIARETIAETVNAQADLVGSDLADQAELIKISYYALGIEDATKLWSSLFSNHYRVSVTYEVTVVLLDSGKTPRPKLLVREPSIRFIPMRRPLIERIEPQLAETANRSITIVGRNLRSENAFALIDDMQVTTQDGNVADDRVVVSIPSNLTAGIKRLQIVHNVKLEDGPSAHSLLRSNVVVFVLAPRIVNILTPSVYEGSELVVDVEPPVHLHQKIDFVIGDHILHYSHGDQTGPITRLSAKIPSGFSGGKGDRLFMLRIRVDDVESLLKADGNNGYTTPMIEIKPS